jgi:hypothetical protein
MKKTTQPIDLTNPKHDWVKHYGRLRIGYLNQYGWWLYGFRKWTWFFCFRFYKKYNYQINEPVSYFQFTIFGFQVGYLYKGKLLTNNQML